jgi:MFS family permease
VVVPLGIGVVAGVLGLRRFGGSVPRRRMAEGGLLTLAVMTVGIAGVGLLHPVIEDAGLELGALPLVVILAFVAGAAYAITSVSAQTTLLESTPGEVRGRVFGVLASIVSAASLGPSLVSGPLADQFSTPFVIALAGVSVLTIAVWSIRRR